MNKLIWKYELEVTDVQKILMPKDAQILTVQVQHEKVCLWAMVDPDAPKQERIIETFGTGNKIVYGIGTDRTYISTYQIYGGDLVFHVFEYLGI